MTITSYIQNKKALVSDYLRTYLKQTTLPQVSPVGNWGNDAVIRLLNSTIQGKMIRASLIFLIEQIFSQKPNPDSVLKTASALELLQTGLLIHDDIMDNDEKRRGKESLHTQYQTLLAHDAIRNPKKTGESFSMCVGDMSFFLAFQILSEIQPIDLSIKLSTLFSQELTKVCVSQMQDVYGGNTKKPFSVKDIETVYEYKTGRYSFGVPLTAGALIAKATGQTITHLRKLGTCMGILFQIKDDELNLYGNPKITGKPVGSDIREGKQTLYRHFLLEKATGKAKERLTSLFGKNGMTEIDTEYVRKQIRILHVDEVIHDIVGQHRHNVDEGIRHLPVTEENRQLFREFVSYLNKRDA